MRLETETTVFKKDSVKDAIKNKVIHQGTEPSGSFAVGDTWFDSANGYKMYVWDGSAWSPEELDSPAIKAGAIKASHIDAGAITADKIAANSITVDKLVVGDMSNLATVNEWDDSSMVTSPAGMATDTMVINHTSGQKGVIKKIATNQYLPLAQPRLPNIFSVGDELYYSVMLRAGSTARNVRLAVYAYDKNGNLIGRNASDPISLTTTMTKFTGSISIFNDTSWTSGKTWAAAQTYSLLIADTQVSGTYEQIRMMRATVQRKNSGDLIVGGQIEGASFKTALGKGYTVDNQEGTITITENATSENYAFLDHAGLKYLSSGGTERATLYPMRYRKLDSGGEVLSTKYGWMTPDMFFAPDLWTRNSATGIGGQVIDDKQFNNAIMQINSEMDKLNAKNDSAKKLNLNPISITNANLTNGSNWDTLGNSWYYKSGTRVHLHIAVTGLTADTTTTVFTMPSGYRPYNYVVSAGRGSTGSVFASMWVNSSGTVSVRTTSTNAAVDIEYDAFN